MYNYIVSNSLLCMKCSSVYYQVLNQVAWKCDLAPSPAVPVVVTVPATRLLEVPETVASTDTEQNNGKMLVTSHGCLVLKIISMLANANKLFVGP